MTPHPTTTRCPSRIVRSPPASAPLRARLGNRPALRGRRHSRPCPPLRLCIAPRLGPASSAYVSLPAQVSRLRRLPFAAVAHSGYAVCPSRRCAYTAYALGMACWGLTCAGRAGSSRRRALRYGRWAAAFSSSFAGGGGVWMSSQPHGGATSATPQRRRPWASARLPRARERRSGSPRESEPATAPRRSRPPSPGSRNACVGSQPPSAPAPQPSPQGSGRPLIAPARPSPAPRGGARAPAPLPGLRQRAPTRHRPRQIRQQPLCASPWPRPRRTTSPGTPTAP